LRRLERAKNKQNKSQAEDIGRIFANKLNEKLAIMKDDKLAKLSKQNEALLKKEEELKKSVFEKIQELDENKRVIKNQKEIIGQKDNAIKLKDDILEEETSFKRKLRTVATIAGLLLISFTVLMAIITMIPMTFEKVAFYTVFLIVGAILLFFGIAPERVVVSIIAKLGFSQSKES
jgi:hypothetical protein